jgi:hypothetical protein
MEMRATPSNIGKGLRKGDTLSPLLFNFVGSVLTKMLAKAAQRGLIFGLGGFRPEGIIVLQYADGTMLFSSPDCDSLRNLEGVLMLFERVSDMRVNFHKSKCIPMNVDEGTAHEIAHILNYPLGVLPLKYLGVPLHFDRLRREDLQPIIDKMIKRVAGWRGKL